MTTHASYRRCKRCDVRIEVGGLKVGRAVFPGGICYRCWVRRGPKKKTNRPHS